MTATLVASGTAATGVDPLPGIQTLSPAQTVSREARIAMDAEGNAVALFFYGDEHSGGRAWCKIVGTYESADCTAAARRWTVDGGLPPRVDLSLRFSARNGEGDVVVDGQGRALAVWAGTAQWGGVGGVVARAMSADGTWSDPEVLAPDPHTPAVGMSAAGDAVVTWLHPVPSGPFGLPEFQVLTRARAQDGTLTPVQDVSVPGVSASDPKVAVAADGDALLVWRAQPDGQTWTVQARSRSADGTLSPIQDLSAPGVNAFAPQVRVDAEGDALVVWQVGLGEGVQARPRAADGTLWPVRTISPADERGTEPQLAMLDDGSALVVWGAGVPSDDMRVRARALSSAGDWSPVETVSLPVTMSFVTWPQVALDQSGRALVVWTQEAGDSLYSPVQGRVRSREGEWSSVRTISSARGRTWQPRVAVSDGGRAVVLWEEYSEHPDHEWGGAMQGRAFSLSDLPVDRMPPQTAVVAGPEGTITKRRVTFRFTSDEPGSTFRCRLDAAAWRACSPPRRYTDLSYGRHVFRVRATDPNGNTDPTPALRRFRVARP